MKTQSRPSIRLHVQVFGELRRILGGLDWQGCRECEIPSGMAVAGLIAWLGASESVVYLVTVNGKRVSPSQVLADGDNVGLVPAVGGGSPAKRASDGELRGRGHGAYPSLVESTMIRTQDRLTAHETRGPEILDGAPYPAEFAAQVRDTLLHLYDTVYLQTHPLAHLMIEEPGDRATMRGKLLLQTMLDAIEALRPAPGALGRSRAGRNHQLLALRYVEGLSVAQVLNQLAISKPQYQRDHARALEAVVSLLWDRWRLSQRDSYDPGDSGSPASSSLREVKHADELEETSYVDLNSTLTRLLTLLRSFDEDNRASLSFTFESALPSNPYDWDILRDGLTALLNAALGDAASGTVTVAINHRGQATELTMTVSPPRKVPTNARGNEIQLRLVESPDKMATH